MSQPLSCQGSRLHNCYELLSWVHGSAGVIKAYQSLGISFGFGSDPPPQLQGVLVVMMEKAARDQETHLPTRSISCG